jgi:hypothetical protein
MKSNLPVVPHDFKVGDEVSYGFNGDSYHDSKVARFTKSGKWMITESGRKYSMSHYQTHRDNPESKWGREDVLKECWVMVGGTWSACKGIHEAQNPHF